MAVEVIAAFLKQQYRRQMSIYDIKEDKNYDFQIIFYEKAKCKDIDITET